MYLNSNTQAIRRNKKETSRSCINCMIDFFKSDSGIFNFCSEECKRQDQYDKNKNPLSTHGKTKKPYHESLKLNNWSACAYDEAVIDNDILNHIEYLCTDEPFIEEDLEYLERVMREEQTYPRYSDGKHYKADPSAKLIEGGTPSWNHRQRTWSISLTKGKRSKERKFEVLNGKGKKPLALIKN
jgi:hypothetical protein